MKDEYKAKSKLISELNESCRQIATIKNSEELFDHIKGSQEKFAMAFLELMVIKMIDVVGNTSTDTGFITEGQRAIFLELMGNLSYRNIKLASTLKLAEEALRASEERFSLSMDATNDGLWDWNIKTETGYFSPGYYRMLGYEVGGFPVKGNAWKELIHPDDLEHAVQLYMDCIEGRYEHFEVEYRMKASNGDWRWILGRGKCVARNERGYALRLVGTHVDITNRKRTEETLKKQRQQLEDANKELESFRYSISHNLRAPLRAIDGFSRMILKKQGANFDKDTKNKFNVIRHNTQTMSRLIDGLLELSRLDRRALTMSAIDMNTLIREVWEEIETINPGRKMSLVIKSMPQGFGDRQLIRQVYSNLLTNAVKFTQNRDVALIEAGGSTDDDIKGNLYYVKDNGAGFDMACYNKLFGIFQHLHSHEEYEGTGVGLAIIQRIINRHGGLVWAKGEVGKGATFFFTMPTRRYDAGHIRQ